MKKFEVYNKSSENMQEVCGSSVDLIVTSPPYGIGTHYGNNADNDGFVEYVVMMVKIISECFRVLKQNGVMVVEVADTIMREGRFIQLAGLIQSIALKAGFHLYQRHINFVNSEDGVEFSEESTEDYSSTANSHSNCHQWIVFSKNRKVFEGGKIFYSNYIPTPEHPCPTPDKTCQIMLDMYFKPGFVVLEPFMGTANMGKHALVRDGKFIGYELDKTIFGFAEKRLESL